MFDVEAYLAKDKRSAETLHPQMRDMLWEQRKKRMYNELNQYKETQRRVPPAQTTALGDRTGWRAPITPNEISTAAINASNQEPAISSNAVTAVPQAEPTPVFNLPTPSNIYADADAELNRQHIRETLAGDPLGAKKQRYGAILDTLAYLTGTTSQRGRFEKSVGTRTTAQKGKDKERQDYIDRVVGSLIMKHQPVNSGQMKTLLESAGITDVDDIKRAFEIYEYFKPEIDDGSAAVVGWLAEDSNYRERRPVMSSLFQSLIEQGVNIDLDRLEAINQLVGGKESPSVLEQDAEHQKNVGVATALYDQMPDEDRVLLKQEGISRDKWISWKAADIYHQHYMKPLVATPVDEDRMAHYKNSTAALIGVLRDDDQKYRDARATSQQAREALQMLEEGLVKTGPMSKTQFVIQRFVNSLIDREKVAKNPGGRLPSGVLDRLKIGFTEYWSSITDLQGAGFFRYTKGPITEKEHAFFVAMAPQLSKTPEGNKLLLKGVIRRQARDVLVHDLTVKYVREKGGINQETMRGYLAWLYNQPEMLDFLQDDSTITAEMMEEARAIITQTESGIPTNSGHTLHESGEKVDLNTPEMAQYKDLADSMTSFKWNGRGEGKMWIKKGNFLIRVND